VWKEKMHVSAQRLASRRSALAGLTCLVAGLLAVVAGCGSSSSANSSGSAPGAAPPPPASGGTSFPSRQLIDAASAEGNVVLYAATAPADNTLFINAFNKAYPHIKVTVTRADPTALEPQILAQIRTKTPTADVYFTTDRQWLLDHESLLTPIQSPQAAAHYKPWFSGGGRIVGFQFHPGGIEWNTSDLSGGVKSFQALAALPRTANIGIMDPELSTGALAWEYYATKTFGADWLKGLLSHQIRFYPESTSLVQAVASGEVEAGVPAFSAVVRDAEQSGAPVGSVLGSPSIVSLMNAAIIKVGQDPYAAQLMVDFALSPAGQVAMEQDKLSPLPNISGSLGVVQFGKTDIADISTISPADQAAFLKQFNRDAGRG
jgi:iron(III) transport system substrate-binding protein